MMKKISENKKINKIIELLIYIISYALILSIVSFIFKNTIQIDYSYLGIWGLFASTIIYILNKTIKPVLVTLTIPITGITLGLFYPFINLFILKLVDWILGPYLELKNIWIALVVAILLSIMNFVMEELIIKPIIRRGKKHGKSSV